MKNMEDFIEPVGQAPEIQFADIFDIAEIQGLQDLFSDTHGVASIITRPDGKPITRPSNFCHLCEDIIRSTEKGRANCFKSDSVIGRQHPGGAISQPCLSGGLWDAGASITVGGTHIANWMIGQVRTGEMDKQRMVQYAGEIGANSDDFLKAADEVPVMPAEQFNKISKLLFVFANMLSEQAYSNLQLKKVVAEQEKSALLLKETEKNYTDIFQTVTEGIAHATLTGEMLLINKALEQMLEVSKEDVIGKNLPDLAKLLLSESNCNIVLPQISNLLQGNDTPPFQLDFRDKILEIKCTINRETNRLTGVVTDITIRRQTEAALEESREKYRGLSEAAFESIFLSEKGRCIEQNLTAEKIFGYSTEEALVRYGTEWIAPEYREMVMNNMLRGYEEPYEAVALRKDGTMFPCMLRGKMMFYKGKNVRVTSLTDITRQKEVEHVLRESEERLRTLIEATPDVICFKDGQGRWLIANEAHVALFSLQNVDYIGKTDFELAGKVDQDNKQGFFSCHALDEKAWQSRDVFRAEENIARHDGTVRAFDIIKVPLFNPDGGRKGLVTLARDITERKQAEKKTRQLSLGIEQSPVAVIITDQAGRIEYVNPKFIEMTRYPVNKVYGKVARILNTVKNPGEFHKQIWQTIASGKEWKGDYISKKITGEDYWESVSISPILDNDGNISNYIILIEDVSDRKRLISELTAAKEKAEQGDRLKSSFLANMSHEIRTPMNAIKGFAGLLIDPAISLENRNQFAGIIQSRSEDLMRIIDDILEISRIESGNATIQKDTVNFNRLLKDIETATLRKTARHNKSHIAITCDIPQESGDVFFISDPFIIKQVFTNLLDNAVKFTDSGSIRYGFHPPENGVITCFVADTGIGIAPENHSLIFEHFRQAEKQDPNLYGGTGLGLSICKGSLALLGGEIRVESTPGEGTVFYFTLPYTPPPPAKGEVKKDKSPDEYKQEAPKTVNPFNWSGKKILLVEDEETNMKLLTFILNRTGAELVCAFNGNAVRQFYNSLDMFSLVLLDVRLPDASGWDLAKEIKERRPDLPVIAQTAYAMASDKEKSHHAGCNGHISKPIRKDQLLQAIAAFLD